MTKWYSQLWFPLFFRIPLFKLLKEFQIYETKIIFIRTKMLILLKLLGTSNYSILFLNAFILWLGLNSWFRFKELFNKKKILDFI